MRKAKKILTYFSYLFAIGLGFATWKWKNVEAAVALALAIVTWLVGRSLELRTAIDDLNEKFERSQELTRLEGRIVSWGQRDDLIERRYREIHAELNMLASGSYYVRGLEQVYRDDIRHINRLQHGETLRSSCPISTKSVSALDQVQDDNYLNSMKAHADASERGVKVKRLYIFSDEKFVTPDLLRHLNEIPRSKNEIRVIFREKLEEKKFDYVVFGNHTVSSGDVDFMSGLCDGTRVSRDSDEVKDAIHKFDDVWNTAIDVDKLTKKLAYARFTPPVAD